MTSDEDSQSPTPLLIFPFNGNGVEAIDCLGGHRLIGFVDDTPEKRVARPFGFDIFDRSAFDDFPEAQVLAIPGSPTSYRSRAQIISGLRLERKRFARVIHPAASVSPLAKIGRNVLIMAGVVITSNCIIGDHVCILPNSVIHHDVTIGDWSLVGSNVTIAGGTEIGENCYISSGSRVKNGLKIGSEALLGMGAVVIRDVAPKMIVAGNPARTIRQPQAAGQTHGN